MRGEPGDPWVLVKEVSKSTFFCCPIPSLSSFYSSRSTSYCFMKIDRTGMRESILGHGRGRILPLKRNLSPKDFVLRVHSARCAHVFLFMISIVYLGSGSHQRSFFLVRLVRFVGLSEQVSGFRQSASFKDGTKWFTHPARALI
jgi:hypothetical protein